MRVKKLILPVAGLGTRLMPLTRHMPKNLLPLAGQPLLAYALGEAQAAGLREIILIVRPEHLAHFRKYLISARPKFPSLRFHLRVQPKPYGNGQVLLHAGDLVRGEPFAVMFPDAVNVHASNVWTSLLKIFERRRSSALLLKRIPSSEVMRYGVVRAKKAGPELHRILNFVEKPKKGQAPSNLVITGGGYVLRPAVLAHLRRMEQNMQPSQDGLPLIRALAREVELGQEVYGWEFPGIWLDCGTLQGLAAAEKFLSRHLTINK